LAKVLINTALPAAMRYILKAESCARRGQGEKLYCIIAGSAVYEKLEVSTWTGFIYRDHILFLKKVTR